MPVPGNIISQLVNVPHETQLAQVALAAIDLAPDEVVPFGTGNICLQYWPESITDERTTEWNPRSIPGGSHPIYQWTQGGERKISFTAMFTTDTDPLNIVVSNDATRARRSDVYENQQGPLGGLQIGTRDMDCRSAASWLRYFTYPMYGQGNDLRVFEPPKIMLVMPGTGLAHNGLDSIVTVMTACSITYDAWFPTGFPRSMEVQVEFAEVVQRGTRVRFHDRRDMLPSGAMQKYGKRFIR